MRSPSKLARTAFALMVGASVLAVNVGGAFAQATPVVSKEQDVASFATRVGFNSPHKKGDIVLDHKRQYLYFVEGDGTALEYKIVVGRQGRHIAAGEFIIFDMRVDPTYAEYPGDNGAMARIGPRNPLGARGMRLKSVRTGAFEGQLIHGTNDPSKFDLPDGTRQFSAGGCIRMLQDGVKDLYERVTNGKALQTRVIVYKGDETLRFVTRLPTAESAVVPVPVPKRKSSPLFIDSGTEEVVVPKFN